MSGDYIVGDHVLTDLQGALRALDTLPNELEVEGLDVRMPVADLAAMLGQLVRFLELQIALKDIEKAKLLLERGRTSLAMGDLDATRRFNERARMLLDQRGF